MKPSMASVTAPSSKGLLAILTTLGITSASCESYEPPCSARDPILLLEAPAATSTIATYPRLDGTAEGTIVASWLTFRMSNEISPGILPVTAEIVVLAGDGDVVARYSLPLFESTPVEDVPKSNFAFCFTPLGVILRWTKDTTVSAIGEAPRIRTSLRVQRLSLDGHAQPSFAPLNMDCVNCIVHVDSACQRDHATILFHAWPEDPLETSPTRVLSWNLATDETIAGPLSWIEPASRQAPPPTLRNDAGTLLLVQESGAWAVDSEGSLRGGPIPLPVASNYLVHWAPETFESLVVWSLAGSAINEQPRDDVFMKRFDGHGRPLTTTKRLGSANRVLALAQDEHDLGLIFGDDGQLAFAWAGTSGSRLGGDVPLGEIPRSNQAGQAIVPGASQLLHALGKGRFVHLIGEPGRLWRREIHCAH
jgi:hypothetical protein